ncbi:MULTISPECIES: hypothetical protein [Rheinheimera]|nr:hypothetical protein [Rheinheimera aquimaris]
MAVQPDQRAAAALAFPVVAGQGLPAPLALAQQERETPEVVSHW